MMSGGVLRLTVTVCCVLAISAAAAGVLTGHAAAGFGLTAGLLAGSLNGFLIASLLERRGRFVVSSLLRLVAFTGLVVMAALFIPGAAWSVALGLGVAQLVLVGAGVRQGLRA